MLAITPGTPKAIVDKLYTGDRRLHALPETLKTLTGMGVEVDEVDCGSAQVRPR